ncbi:hypothetical protein [Bradyrhizobium sp. WD16]|uniref:hypothetical protein n=1 Tax=Bradyrhizobium sp. WD16 TaxID=1521768 RepID=UPI0020A46E10|nr:hypothetical protein [Bradyrhizobium sp. WD16]
MTQAAHRPLLVAFLVMLMVPAGGCSAVNRLSMIGERPAMSSIDDPTAAHG